MQDALGDRMKGYEYAFRTELPKRFPVILRVDGRAFHTYTRRLQRPFDLTLTQIMEEVAADLCEEISGAQIAYTQSDEISVLIHGYKKFDTQPWFNNQVQKMVSIAAATASTSFTLKSWRLWGTTLESVRPALFDARIFILPEADVCNYFLWRQQDAMRNSVQMLARSLFSHKEVDHKNVEQMKEMCAAKGTPWDSLENRYRVGGAVRRVVTNQDNVVRSSWKADPNTPVFSQDRDYIEKYLALDSESEEGIEK